MFTTLTKAHPGLALLVPHYRRHLSGFILGFCLISLTTVSAAAIPLVMKLATESITRHPETTWSLAALLVVLALITALLRRRSRTHVFRLGREVEYALRREYHSHLLTLDTPFFDQARAGDLLFRGTNDILAIRMFIGPGFLQLTNTLLAYAITLPVMLHLDPELTLLALSPYPVVLVAARLLTRRLYRLSRQTSDRFGDLTGWIQETLSGMSIVQNHVQEEHCLERMRGHLDRLYQSHTRHATLQSLFSPMMMFGGGLSSVLILGLGGEKVASGFLTMGDFVAFSGYMAMLVWPTIGLGWIITVLQRGLAGLNRLHQIMAMPGALAVDGEAHAPTWSGGISVRGLHFSHPGGEGEVLHDISMEIAPGEFVGLVGRVGSGKTTLLQCMAGLKPVPEGTVFLDGQEIHTIAEGTLRANLAMVPQESFLFSQTIEENLLYGHPDPATEKAWDLAKSVALAEEIQFFPRGMHTLVGERGLSLSGGQRQRVALARALAVRKPLLLLDDIFSSVDARTEAVILEQISSSSRAGDGRQTVVMVCHRVEALHRADVIFVLDQGRIVAKGDHRTLLSTCPLYGELHAKMTRAEILETLT